MTGPADCCQNYHIELYGVNNDVKKPHATTIFRDTSLTDGSDISIFGQSNSLTGGYGHIFGDRNNAKTGTRQFVDIFGNGLSLSGNGNKINVFGSTDKVTASPFANVTGNRNTSETGRYAITLGVGNTSTGAATDTGGIEIGSGNTQASALNGTVIANGSSATGANSLVFGSGSQPQTEVNQWGMALFPHRETRCLMAARISSVV